MIVFRIYLDEIQPILLSYLLTLLICYNPFTLQVIFVTDQQNLHVRIAIGLDFLKPPLYMLECLFSGNIVDKESSYCASIIRTCDRSEILLSCSIPNLQLDIFVFNINSLCPKLNSDGHIMSCSCLILNELQNNA